MSTRTSLVKLVYGVDLGNTDDTVEFFKELKKALISLYPIQTDIIEDLYSELEFNNIEKFFLNFIAFEESIGLDPSVDLCVYNFNDDRRFILHPIKITKHNTNKCIQVGSNSKLRIKNKMKIGRKTNTKFYEWLSRYNVSETFPILVPDSYHLKWMVVSYNFNGDN